ncbi:MAG: 3-dehydroquinate synthase family protein, partial [Brevinematales bacterium]
PYGKNLVGSFHFPSLVIADTAFLQTLPEKQKKNGFVEMVKHAITLDQKYYDKLMKPVSDKDWPALLLKSCKIKAKIVQKDPREKNMRQILNFGHTLGHALEHAAGYSLLHGFAVAWGIIGEAFLSVKKQFLSQSDLHRLIRDFQNKGLLVSPEIITKLSWEDVRLPLLHDKKNQNGIVYVVLIKKIGQVKTLHGRYSHPFDEVSLKEAFMFLQKIAEDMDERH